MHTMAVFTELRKLLGRQDSIAFDGGDFCRFGRPTCGAPPAWMVLLLHLRHARHGSSHGAGDELARPETNVVVATGDGGFGFNGFELDTAVRHGINVVVVLGNDAAWGIDRQIQLGVYGWPVVTDLLPTRYDVVARGGRPQLQPAPALRTSARATGRPRSGPTCAGTRGGLPLRKPTLGGGGAALVRLRNTARTSQGSREEQPRAPTAPPSAVISMRSAADPDGWPTPRHRDLAASPCMRRMHRIAPWSLINGITGYTFRCGSMNKTVDIPTAEEIARMADRGEDVSSYFTNRGSMKMPVQRVNVDIVSVPGRARASRRSEDRCRADGATTR